jgi:hypothetical protein
MLLTGVALGIAATVAALARPQVLTLKVDPDGLSLSGDLRGTGFEIS